MSTGIKFTARALRYRIQSTDYKFVIYGALFPLPSPSPIIIPDPLWVFGLPG